MNPFTEKPKPCCENGFIGSGLRVHSWTFKHVARHVLGHELVIGKIIIERSDEIVAIAKGVGGVVIKLVPPALGVAKEIHPVTSPFLAKLRGCQQAIDDFFIGIGRIILDKSLYLLS